MSLVFLFTGMEGWRRRKVIIHCVPNAACTLTLINIIFSASDDKVVNLDQILMYVLLAINNTKIQKTKRVNSF